MGRHIDEYERRLTRSRWWGERMPLWLSLGIGLAALALWVWF